MYASGTTGGVGSEGTVFVNTSTGVIYISNGTKYLKIGTYSNADGGTVISTTPGGASYTLTVDTVGNGFNPWVPPTATGAPYSVAVSTGAVGSYAGTASVFIANSNGVYQYVGTFNTLYQD